VNIDSDGMVLVFGDAEVAVGEHPVAATLTAWPNPAADQVRIAGLDGAGTWELVDAQGRVHQQGSHTPGMLMLDLAPLASGHYVLVTRGGNGSQRVKLARQ